MAALNAGGVLTSLNRILKKLQYAVMNDAVANSPVATGDAIITLDASNNYEPSWSTVAQVALAAAGGTAGTVVASSPVVVDANKDISTFRNLSATQLASTNMMKIPINTPVAGAGTVIGDAAPILTGFTVITGANGTVGWLLPVTTGGDVVIIKGTTAGVAKIWPQTGAQINAVGASTAMSLASGVIPAIIISISATQWYTLPLLPS